MLTASEQAALAVFRSFQVGTGQMLCFHGPQLEKHRAPLRQLTEKNLVVKEQFAGGYSLTRAGFEAMTATSEASRAQSPSRGAAAPRRSASAR